MVKAMGSSGLFLVQKLMAAMGKIASLPKCRFLWYCTSPAIISAGEKLNKSEE
jgi:hypothetical protein